MAGFGGEEAGKAIGGFFKDDLLKHWTNEELHNVQEQQALALGGLKAKADAAAAAYAAAVGKSTPAIEALNLDTQGRLSGLADQFTGFDPVANYERVRGGNIASLADQFTKLASLGQEGDKTRLASLGYGGRGPSSYESILRSDRISRNIAPVLDTIYRNLGTDTAGLNNNRLQNLAATLAILKERGMLPGATDARALLPYQAEAGLFGGQVGLGGELANATGANFQGFETKKNPWKNFFEEGGKSADRAFDAYMSIYGGGMLGGGGGGGLGGIMGGGGGGGGGGAVPSTNGGYGFMPSYSPRPYTPTSVNNPYAQFYY